MTMPAAAAVSLHIICCALLLPTDCERDKKRKRAIAHGRKTAAVRRFLTPTRSGCVDDGNNVHRDDDDMIMMMLFNHTDDDDY